MARWCLGRAGPLDRAGPNPALRACLAGVDGTRPLSRRRERAATPRPLTPPPALQVLGGPGPKWRPTAASVRPGVLATNKLPLRSHPIRPSSMPGHSHRPNSPKAPTARSHRHLVPAALVLIRNEFLSRTASRQHQRRRRYSSPGSCGGCSATRPFGDRAGRRRRRTSRLEGSRQWRLSCCLGGQCSVPLLNVSRASTTIRQRKLCNRVPEHNGWKFANIATGAHRHWREVATAVDQVFTRNTSDDEPA